MNPRDSLTKLYSTIVPTLVEARDSDYNQTIQVYKHLGSHRIVVENLTQSGGMVQKIWKQAIIYLDKKYYSKQKPKNILILGSSAGSTIVTISKIWPDTHVTGIEIDPVMIEIGKRYFGLGEIKNTKIINADAFKWLDKNDRQFDLVFTDLYIGRGIPEPAETVEFFENVRNHLKPRGHAVFNRLTLTDQKQQAEQFKQNLEKVFKTVNRIPTTTNWLLLAYD